MLRARSEKMGGNENNLRWSASQVLAWIIRQEPLKLERREWTSDMGPGIEDAKRRLAAAIASGQVRAWGREKPHGLAEKMPSDPFRISGLSVVVGVHGEITTLEPHKPYVGPVWHSIEFEADEIQQAFPKPPPLSAIEWMQIEANRHAAGNYSKSAKSCCKTA
jgi:hypothetical protein